ncbi:MAG TPA: hypothetical protein VFW83_06255 [Bryobacteraceae bacterium]|nr:hypothetical protein [Bryobacteraceae bacterium]
MRWRFLILMLLAVSAFGETVRLYLKDGSYQLASKYEVLQDRVKYYSTERDQWEEIPLALIDLDRTKKEAAAREKRIEGENKAQDQEDAALRAEQQEIARIPVEPGVYYIHGPKLEPLKQAEVKIATDKKRSVLKVLAPIPIVPGKSTVEIDGPVAKFRVSENRPEFYFRLADIDGFAIVKLSGKKDRRIVENADIMPVTDEIVEDRNTVATFKKELGDQLFKIWPEKALEPGEYALIEYAEGKLNPQVWDFGAGPAK